MHTRDNDERFKEACKIIIFIFCHFIIDLIIAKFIDAIRFLQGDEIEVVVSQNAAERYS
jgi:hypothetical protein